MKTPEEIYKQHMGYDVPINELEQGNFIWSDIKILMEEYASQFREKPKKTIQERESDFVVDVSYYQNEYSLMDMQNFISYWTEIGDNQKKMRFEKEKVFDIKKRLERWKRNQKNFNNGKPEKRSTESAAHSFITE